VGGQELAGPPGATPDSVANHGIDAAQIKGVLSLTADEFRYGFGNAVSEEESNQLHQQWARPVPGQAATANFTLHSSSSTGTR
jgi:hypothetical protein